MAAFKTQIEDLIGSVGDDTALTSWLNDGGKELINIMPSHLLALCASQSTFTSTIAGSEAETLNTAKILNVFRNDGDIDQPCRQIDATIKGRVADPYEMQYATVTDPVYYIENNKINALPDGGSCKYSEVQYPVFDTSGATSTSVDIDDTGDTTVPSFPDEAEYLLVLYAAIKGLQRKMADKTSDLPSDVSFPVISVAPSAPSFDAGSISVSSSAPTYTKPVFSVPTLATVGSLTMPVPPSVPSISSQSVTITGTAPSYLGPSFTTINTYIDTNEDIELGQAKLQEINSQIQDGLNKFNDDNVEYQAKLQKDIQDAQLSDAHEARKLQKYQAEVSQYQAESSSNLQEWINEEWNQKFQKYQQDYGSKLQQYNTDLQNELNKFNKEQTVFQNELQEKIQEATNQQTKDSAEYSAKIQKYANQTQAYSSEVNTKVQDFNTKLQKHTKDYEWLMGQHKQLMDDYNRGVQILTGGGQPQRG